MSGINDAEVLESGLTVRALSLLADVMSEGVGAVGRLESRVPCLRLCPGPQSNTLLHTERVEQGREGRNEEAQSAPHTNTLVEQQQAQN